MLETSCLWCVAPPVRREIELISLQGVTSATSFAEAAMVDPEAIDDLIDAARNKTEGVMSSYLAIMLKKLLKRRFGQSDRPLMALAHTSSLR